MQAAPKRGGPSPAAPAASSFAFGASPAGGGFSFGGGGGGAGGPSGAPAVSLLNSLIAAGFSADSSAATAAAAAADAKKQQYTDTEAFRLRRGVVAKGDSEPGLKGQYVWTPQGFGLVLHDSKLAREAAAAAAAAAAEAAAAEAKAKEAAASSSSSSSSQAAADSDALPAPQPVPAQPALVLGEVPDAPPLASPAPSSSPSLSRSSFLQLVKTISASAASAAPGVPVVPKAVLTMPELPDIDTENVPQPCLEDCVAVHLLPHYSRATTASAASWRSLSSPSSSSFNPYLSSSSSAANAAAIVANAPTVLYTPSSSVHPLIRVRVRTFLDLAAMMPKAKPTDEEATGKENKGKGLASALGAEIRARKEKADREKLVKEAGGSSVAAQLAAVQALFAAESSDKSKSDDEEKKTAAAPQKPDGPPPSSCVLTLPASASLRELLQGVVEYYSPWGITLDMDNMRLVSGGVEVSKAELPRASVVGQGVVAPSSSASAVASSSSSAAPSVFQSKVGASMALFAEGSEERQQLALMERLAAAASKVVGAGGSAPSRGAGSLQNVQQLLAAVKQSASGDSKAQALRSLTDAIGALEGAIANLPDNKASNIAAAAQGNKGPSPTERDRFYRAHTMLAECGLVPVRSAAVQPAESSSASASASAAAPSADAAAAASAAASSSSSASSTSQPLPPLFNLLLVYDDQSRFLLDAASAPPGGDLVVAADGLSATMVNADNKWLTLRASSAFTRGRHQWTVKMDRCAGGNVFLGLCTSTMRLANYIGHDAQSWGYYGCGNIYRAGSSSSYGSAYRTGDAITLMLDMDARTLSYAKNGQQLGVAFSDLPDSVYPAFSLYTKNDQISIGDFATF